MMYRTWQAGGKSLVITVNRYIRDELGVEKGDWLEIDTKDIKLCKKTEARRWY